MAAHGHPAKLDVSKVRRRPLRDGEDDGGRGWGIGLRYPHLLGETWRVTSVYCEAVVWSTRPLRSETWYMS